MASKKCEREKGLFSFDVGRFLIQTIIDIDDCITGYDVLLDGERKIASFSDKGDAIDFARKWMQRLSEIEEEIIEEGKKRAMASCLK